MQNQQYNQHNYSQPNQSGTTAGGLSANLAALLCYLFVPVTGIVFLLVEKENRLVRFHAAQSLLYGAALVVLSIVLGVVLTVLTGVVGAVSSVGAFAVSLVSLLLWLGVFLVSVGLAIWCMVKAFQGAMYKLPVVGNMAERMTAR